MSEPADPVIKSVPAATFRLPRSAYLAVLFLFMGAAVLARGWVWLPVFLIPLLAGWFIARRATVFSDRGIEVRAMFGRRRVPWADVRGLVVDERGQVSASLRGEAVLALPCVRSSHLPAMNALTGGRVPAIEDVRRPAPAPRRRR